MIIKGKNGAGLTFAPFFLRKEKKMERTDLTRYDIKPEAMLNYLRYNGPHFSKRLCEFAVGGMKRKDGIRLAKVSPWSKEDVEKLLTEQGVNVANNVSYDAVYVANMCKADYLGKSVPDEPHVALFIKDYLDDEDGYEGIAFNRFLADCARKGIVIPWEDVI